MSVVRGNPQVDFKEQNPQLCSFGVFKEVYDKHKEPSKFCWSMFMIEEMNKTYNQLAGLSREQRIDEVIKTYYNIDVSSPLYVSLAEDYKKYALSKEEYLFSIQLRKLEELTLYLDQLDVTKDSEYEKIMKIMEKISKFWESLDKIKENMINAANKTTIRGNAKLSKREQQQNIKSKGNDKTDSI